MIKAGQQREMTAVVAAGHSRGESGPGGDVLVSWAEKLSGRARKRARGVLRFAFYGRVSTEDWQDPVTSRARQLQQAMMLVAGAGVIAAEFFDTGESRTLPWARRPQAAALVAQLADPERGWDAIMCPRLGPRSWWYIPESGIYHHPKLTRKGRPGRHLADKGGGSATRLRSPGA